MKVEEIIDKLQNAVKSSGKSFDSIPKEMILKFLRDSGIRNEQQLEEIFKGLKKNNQTNPSVSEVKLSEPSKKPKKSIFGEIKRVA